MRILARTLLPSSIVLPDPVLSLPEVGHILVSVLQPGLPPVAVLVSGSVAPLHVPVVFCHGFSFSAPAHVRAFPPSPSVSSFLVDGVVSQRFFSFRSFLLRYPPLFLILFPLFVSGDLDGFFCALSWFHPVAHRPPTL